jgi:hypothetical protein
MNKLDFVIFLVMLVFRNYHHRVKQIDFGYSKEDTGARLEMASVIVFFNERLSS